MDIKHITVALILASITGCAITRESAVSMNSLDLCDASYGFATSNESKLAAQYELRKRMFDCSQHMAAKQMNQAIMLQGAQYFNDMAARQQQQYLQNRPTTCTTMPLGQSYVTNCN